MRTDAEKIDADRKRRERELLLILLLFAARTRRYAVHALRLGIDPVQAMRLPWLGGTHFGSVAKPLARVMADAHVGGFRTAARLLNLPSAAVPTVQEMAVYYAPRAQALAGQMLATMQDAAAKGIGVDSGPSELKAALIEAGYGPDAPAALERAVEVPVVQSHADGMARAYQKGEHSGYRHHTVDDKGTTKICRARDGLLLPKDDPYWQSNWPMLHFGCRSIVLPVFGAHAWSTTLPAVPPAPGWGQRPVWFGEARAAA